MGQHDTFVYDSAWLSPVGWVGLSARDGALSRLALRLERPAVAQRAAPVIDQAVEMLQAYFAGEMPTVLPPMAEQGTPFQRRVWERLGQIGWGETLTYGELAAELGTHPRAVGGACRANPVVILVPCHRVVAANGKGGFVGHATGAWPAIKERLLAHETLQAA